MEGLKQLIDNELYYCLAVTLAGITAFAVGLIIGLVWIIL